MRKAGGNRPSRPDASKTASIAHLSGLAIGLAVLIVSILDTERAEASKFTPPPMPSYLRSLGKPTATGYNLGDHGVPYDCLFWKRRGGVEVVEYCVVDDTVGATLWQGHPTAGG